MFCRDAFGHVLECTMALVSYLKDAGPERVHNVDNLLLRESMDVIGGPSALESLQNALILVRTPPDSKALLPLYEHGTAITTPGG